MANRRPLVLAGGFPKELPNGDALVGHYYERQVTVIGQGGAYGISTSWVTVVSNSWSVEAGWYMAGCSYHWAYNSTTSDFLARLYLDVSTNLIMEHVEEPQDSGGVAGLDVPLAGTDQRRVTSYEYPIELTDGSHSLTLQVAPSVDTVEASIWYASVWLKKISE